MSGTTDLSQEEKVSLIPIKLNESPKAVKLTRKNKLRLLELLAKSWNITRACSEIGVSRQGLYEYLALNRDLSFKKAFQQVKDSHLDDIEEFQIEQGKKNEKNFVPGIFQLKSHRREIYGDRVEVDAKHELKIENPNLEIRALLANVIPSHKVEDAEYEEVG